jgi:ribose-phosphate pyrophosphokinase
MRLRAVSESDLVLFALNASRAFGERLAERLGVALGAHEERDFEDGEHKARPLENVRGRDVFLVQSLYGDTRQSVDDKLVRRWRGRLDCRPLIPDTRFLIPDS